MKTSTNYINSKADNRGRYYIQLNGKTVALVSGANSKSKLVLYISKRISTELATFEKVFCAKNSKKTIRPTDLKINPTYLTSGGKDPYYVKVDFAKATCNLEDIAEAVATLAQKSGNYPAPAEVEPEEVETEAEPA